MSYKGTKLSEEAKRLIGEANRKPTVKIECVVCRKTFEVWPSRAERQKPKYCSQKCYGKHLKKQTPWNKGITADKDSRLASAKRHGMYGKRSPRWNGGRFIEQGYVLVWCPKHPQNRRGYVKEHRLIMEKQTGRYLKRDEVVHHKNGITTDNRTSNLELMTKYEHAKLHYSRNGSPRKRI
jgi:hypothetical protein